MRRSAGDKVSLGHICPPEGLKHHETDLAFIIWTRLAEPNASSGRLLTIRRTDSRIRRCADEKKAPFPGGTALVVIRSIQPPTQPQAGFKCTAAANAVKV